MKIVDIAIEKVSFGLRRPYRIAYKEVNSVEQVVVKVVTDQGDTVLGTANPSAYVVGESVDDAFTCLLAADLDFLLGADVRRAPGLVREIARRFPQNPGAAAALDIAVHDLWARMVGLPLCDLLGRQHKALPTSITIGIKDVAETLIEADEYVGRGFRVLKIKLGEGLEADVERLTRIHERFGQRVVMRVDMNQAYDLDTTRQFFATTAALDLELVEQPLPAASVDACRTLPDDIRAKIFLDESVKGPRDALAIVTPPAAAGGINIKLMKCGGIKPALDIATIAEHAGTDLMWGCNDESVISIAAALHAALACPRTRFLDLDGSLDLASDVARGGFTIEDGVMSPMGGPGLGVEIG